MNTDRNPYVVTKALNSYLKGSVIIAISGHLVTTSDALIVSWLIGSKAFTAINIVIPVLTLFSAIMVLLGTGASISISKSLGKRDKNNVNLSFSSTFIASVIIGVIMAILTYKFTSEIVRYLVHTDVHIEHYAFLYLKNFCYAVPFLIVGGTVGYMVRTDGNSNLVSTAVWIGIILNVVLDFIFIRFLNYGVAGAAWATAINYGLKLIICLFHFFSRNNTIRWSFDIKHYLQKIFYNCRLGFSTSLNTLLPAVTLFIINNIMLRYHGSEGIYCWAVCYQVFLILQMIISGIDTSIFAIGGVLLGEEDVKGLDILYKRCSIYLIISIVLLSAAIILFPEFFGNLFGNKGEDKLDLLPSVLKIFSFFLLPYALIMQVRSIYTILERSFLSLFLCIAPFVIMVVLVYFASVDQIPEYWWSFPVTAWGVLALLFMYTLVIRLRNHNLRMFSLIPKTMAGPSYNVSVPLNGEAVNATERDIKDFLTAQNVNAQKIEYITSCSSKIMEDIVKDLLQNAKNNKYFDINLRIKGNNIIIILKDAGKRIDEKREEEIFSNLNQIASSATKMEISSDTSESGKLSVTNQSPNFSTNYFYMNNQNTFTINFN